MADEKNNPSPEKKPYVNPLNNLTQEQWERAMRQGLEDSANQSASIRRDFEVYEQNKKTDGPKKE